MDVHVMVAGCNVGMLPGVYTILKHCMCWQGVKGITCIWRANDEYIDKFNLALDLPTEMVTILLRASCICTVISRSLPCHQSSKQQQLLAKHHFACSALPRCKSLQFAIP